MRGGQSPTSAAKKKGIKIEIRYSKRRRVVEEDEEEEDCDDDDDVVQEAEGAAVRDLPGRPGRARGGARRRCMLIIF